MRRSQGCGAGQSLYVRVFRNGKWYMMTRGQLDGMRSSGHTVRNRVVPGCGDQRIRLKDEFITHKCGR